MNDEGLRGLSAAEVDERREADGCNELSASRRRGIFADVVALLREPMSLLRLVCGGI